MRIVVGIACFAGGCLLWLVWQSAWPAWLRWLVLVPGAAYLGAFVWGFFRGLMESARQQRPCVTRNQGRGPIPGHQPCPGPEWVQRIITGDYNPYAPDGDWPTKGMLIPAPPAIPGLISGAGQTGLNQWSYEVNLDRGAAPETIRDLVLQLQPGHEAGFNIPDDLESMLQVRRTVAGLESKTSHHGCFGTWRATSHEKAIKHLLPALDNLHYLHLRQEYPHGVYYIEPAGKETVPLLIWEKAVTA